MFRLTLLAIVAFSATQSISKKQWSKQETEDHYHQVLKQVVEGNGFETVLGGYVNHEPLAKMLDVHNRRMRLRARKLEEETAATSNLRGSKARKLDDGFGPCDPDTVNLEDSPQWLKEKGYWEGELSLYNENGDASTSDSWPYQYDHYKGFITSSVQGNTYKQRNIFIYPALGHQPISEELFDNHDAAETAKNEALAKGSGKTRAEKRAARVAYRQARKALMKEIRRNLRRGSKLCAAKQEEIDAAQAARDAYLAVEGNNPMFAPKVPTLEVGNGTCGVKGNTKLFEAEQAPLKCSNNPELAGDIEGPYGTMSYTYTQLVGKDNAVLYQVFLTKGALSAYEMFVLKNPFGRCRLNATTAFKPLCGTWVFKNEDPDTEELEEPAYPEDRLMQSQLTTLTELKNYDGSIKQQLRTRTAQGFDAFKNVGAPSYASFYREKKVAGEEQSSAALEDATPDRRSLDHVEGHIGGTFYPEMGHVQRMYNIDGADMGAHASSQTGGTVDSGLAGLGVPRVMGFLEESFHSAPEAPVEP